MQGSNVDGTSQQAAASGAGSSFSGGVIASRFVPKKLGEILLEERLVSQEKLNEALAIQKVKGGFLGQILVEMGLVTQQAMSSCLVRQCKIPHLSLQDYEIGEDVLKLLPQEVCLRYYLLPIDKMGRILTLAMVDPLDAEALEDVRRLCPDLRIKPILCDWLHFQVVAAKVFHRQPELKTEEEELAAFGKKYGLDMSKKMTPTAPSAPAPPHPDPIVEAAPAPPHPDPIIEAAPTPSHPDPVVAHGSPPAEIPSPVPTAETDAALDAAVFDLLSEMSSNTQETNVIEPPAVSDHGGTTVETSSAVVEAPSITSPLENIPPEVVHQDQGSPAEAPQVAQSVEEVIEETSSPEVMLPVEDASSAVVAIAEHVVNDPVTPVSPIDSTQHLDQVIRRSVESAISDVLSTGAVPETVQRVMTADETLAVSRANLRDLEARDAERAKRMKYGISQGSESNRRRTEVATHTDDQVLLALTGERLLPGLTFDTFVSGKNNAFSYKLCQAVAANPGGDFNPFFIYGDVGLGKTHLVNAIGHAIQTTQPDQRLCYISSSRFAARLQEATRDHAEEMFRANYCHWDALILDDIQFLGGRVEAQEEFFHLFNVLQQEERQIIIAGDKPPDRLGLLEQRLVSRFGSGVVAQVKPPEFEARLQILERASLEAEADIEEDALVLIATRVADDVRKMMGALRKLLAFAKLMDQRVTAEMAAESLGHLAP